MFDYKTNEGFINGLFVILSIIEMLLLFVGTIGFSGFVWLGGLTSLVWLAALWTFQEHK